MGPSLGRPLRLHGLFAETMEATNGYGIDMSSDAPALRRPASPADQIARWLDHFRDRINVNSVDAHARKPVRLLLAGPRAAEMFAMLDPDLGASSLIIERVEDASGPIIGDRGTRALLYCRATEDAQLDAAPYA